MGYTISPASLEKWRGDLRRMTKIYRSVPAAPEDKQLELFQEAKGLFRTFHDNFETWVYDTLLSSRDHAKQSWSENQVAKTAWSFLATISPSTIFPDSYNYRTEKHEPDPYELARKIDQNVTRYQRAFNIAMKDIESLLELKAGEGKTVHKLEPTEQFHLGSLTIVVHNQGREERGAEESLDDELRTLTNAVGKMNRAGFPQAAQGLTVHISFIQTKLRAGQYAPAEDELYLFPLGLGRENNETFIHECGHRFYYRTLPGNARKHWEEVIDSRAVRITEEDIDRMVDKYIRPHFQRTQHTPFRDQLEQVIHEDSEELEAKYRELADRMPAFEGSNDPEVVRDWWKKNLLDERVNLEHISDYGATDAKEAFAEAFMLYVVNGPGAVGPWTRQFFETVSRSGGAKFARAAVRHVLRKRPV